MNTAEPCSAEGTAVIAPKLSIVVVSYGGEELLRDCLRSIPEAVGGAPLEVVVADNASPDGTPDMVAREFPWVTLLRGESNVGFAAGNNRALRVCRGQYVMLLNPDAELLPGTLTACLEHLDAHEDVSVVAPRIVNPDHSLQFSLRNFPTARNALFEALLLHRVFPRATPRFGEMIVDPQYYEGEREVQWASGAAFVARSEVFDEVGGLDERYFLYCEETDWFLRLADRGLKVAYLPKAVVAHRSSEGRNADLMSYAVTSRLLYASKNLSAPSGAILKAVLLLGMSARFVAWTMLALAGGDSATTRSREYRVGLHSAVSHRTGGATDV